MSIKKTCLEEFHAAYIGHPTLMAAAKSDRKYDFKQKSRLKVTSHEWKFTAEWNSKNNHNRRKESRVITAEL